MHSTFFCFRIFPVWKRRIFIKELSKSYIQQFFSEHLCQRYYLCWLLIGDAAHARNGRFRKKKLGKSD